MYEEVSESGRCLRAGVGRRRGVAVHAVLEPDGEHARQRLVHMPVAVQHAIGVAAQHLGQDLRERLVLAQACHPVHMPSFKPNHVAKECRVLQAPCIHVDQSPYNHLDDESKCHWQGYE